MILWLEIMFLQLLERKLTFFYKFLFAQQDFFEKKL